MEKALEASWLTTSDVARRLGVQGGTVRHYGEILRGRGYPFTQGENGEWLWAPEVVEVARAAYLLAKAVPGMSFERALDYLEYAGRVAVSAKPGTTLPEVLNRLDHLPERLAQVGPRVEKGMKEVVDHLRARAEQVMIRSVEDLRQHGGKLMADISAKTERLEVATREVEGLLRFIVVVPMFFLGVLALLLTLHALAAFSLPGWFPWLGVGVLLGVGYLLGKVV